MNQKPQLFGIHTPGAFKNPNRHLLTCFWHLSFHGHVTPAGFLKWRLQQFDQVNDVFFRFFFSCSISGNICYFENSRPINFFIDHCCLFSLNFCSIHCPHLWLIWRISYFQFLFHFFKPVLFIFLDADYHSNTGISWIIISSVCVALKKKIIEALRCFCLVGF